MTPTPEPAETSANICRCICTKCGHVWNPKTGKPPRRCAKCRQTNWQLQPWDSSLTIGTELPSIPQETLRLPNTCPENRKSYTHCKVLTTINPNAWNGAGFDGPIFEAGARISAAEIQKHPVVIEFAGPQGTWKQKRNRREDLYVLWRYDWEAGGWKEIARALAHDWTWCTVLRDPAIRALEPRRESTDERERAGIVLDQVLAAIDSSLSLEVPAVRTLVLAAVYERVAGRLARHGN